MRERMQENVNNEKPHQKPDLLSMILLIYHFSN